MESPNPTPSPDSSQSNQPDSARDGNRSHFLKSLGFKDEAAQQAANAESEAPARETAETVSPANRGFDSAPKEARVLSSIARSKAGSDDDPLPQSSHPDAGDVHPFLPLDDLPPADLHSFEQAQNKMFDSDGMALRADTGPEFDGEEAALETGPEKWDEDDWIESLDAYSTEEAIEETIETPDPGESSQPEAEAEPVEILPPDAKAEAEPDESTVLEAEAKPDEILPPDAEVEVEPDEILPTNAEPGLFPQSELEDEIVESEDGVASMTFAPDSEFDLSALDDFSWDTARSAESFEESETDTDDSTADESVATETATEFDEVLDVNCPSCDQILSLRHESLGTQGQCVWCQTPIVAAASGLDGKVRVFRVATPESAVPDSDTPAAESPAESESVEEREIPSETAEVEPILEEESTVVIPDSHGPVIDERPHPHEPTPEEFAEAKPPSQLTNTAGEESPAPEPGAPADSETETVMPPSWPEAADTPEAPAQEPEAPISANPPIEEPFPNPAEPVENPAFAWDSADSNPVPGEEFPAPQPNDFPAVESPSTDWSAPQPPASPESEPGASDDSAETSPFGFPALNDPLPWPVSDTDDTTENGDSLASSAFDPQPVPTDSEFQPTDPSPMASAESPFPDPFANLSADGPSEESAPAFPIAETEGADDPFHSIGDPPESETPSQPNPLGWPWPAGSGTEANVAKEPVINPNAEETDPHPVAIPPAEESVAELPEAIAPVVESEIAPSSEGDIRTDSLAGIWGKENESSLPQDSAPEETQAFPRRTLLASAKPGHDQPAAENQDHFPASPFTAPDPTPQNPISAAVTAGAPLTSPVGQAMGQTEAQTQTPPPVPRKSGGRSNTGKTIAIGIIIVGVIFGAGAASFFLPNVVDNIDGALRDHVGGVEAEAVWPEGKAPAESDSLVETPPPGTDNSTGKDRRTGAVPTNPN